jgi:ornithine decarboxylase
VTVTQLATSGAPMIRQRRAATPVVTVDLATVARSYEALQAALPSVALHYAVKANPNPAVVSTLARRGARWDVASVGEIDTVLAVDPDPSHLSYGNTIKKVSDIRYAYRVGIRRFVLDCDGELDKLLLHAPGATLLVRIATSGAGADWALGNKFGCDEDTAARLLQRAVDHGHPVGVSFHVGTQQRDVHAWAEPLQVVRRLRDGLRARGADLEVVNLGGGFPSVGASSSPTPVPPMASYGDAILDALHRSLGPDLPEVMAEPGRALVGDAGVLETEVVLVAERGGDRWVYLDAGVFTGLVETLEEAIRYRITAERDGVPLGGELAPAILAGPTCDSADVLYARNQPLLPADLQPGDRLIVHGTGAYTATYSTVGFNGFSPLREVCR